MGKKWRIRVSIPVPPACKAGALPLELIPQSVSQVSVTPIKENGILRFLRNELSLSKLLIKLRVFKCIIATSMTTATTLHIKVKDIHKLDKYYQTLLSFRLLRRRENLAKEKNESHGQIQ